METLLGTVYVFLFVVKKMQGKPCIGTKAVNAASGKFILDVINKLLSIKEYDFADGSEILKLPHATLPHIYSGDAPDSLLNHSIKEVKRTYRGNESVYLDRDFAELKCKYAQVVIYTRERFLGDKQVQDDFPLIHKEVTDNTSIKHVLIDIQGTAASVDGIPLTSIRLEANIKNGQNDGDSAEELAEKRAESKAYDDNFVVVADSDCPE